MIRYSWLIFLIGCAGSSTRPEGPLDRLIEKSNAYASFHLKAEISDGRQTVPIEMAFKAPDRALLKYGTVETWILGGGKSHHLLRGAYSVTDTAALVAELRERYPGLAVGKAPEPVFLLGDGVRARLVAGRLGARLGWLEELRVYKAEGNVYKHGATEIVLRDDGFIERTTVAGTSFTLKSVVVGSAVPDSVFEAPAAGSLPEMAARMKAAEIQDLENAYHRWILETSTSDETLETMVRVDLLRRYDPEKLASVLDAGLKKTLAAFRALHPDAKPELVKDKLVIERGKAMGSVEIIEDEIEKAFEKDLDGYFRGMSDPPPQKAMLDIARRWNAAVKKQVDEQIRARFAAVFDAAEKPQ